MEEPQKCPLKRGDILENGYAGDCNPNKRIIFVRCCDVQGYPGYDCLNYCGKIVKQFQDNDKLKKIGHMKEYDDFVNALKKLDRSPDDAD